MLLNTKGWCVMTDDIVTQLRGYDFMRDGDIPDVVMNKAADEIEKLRKTISYIKIQGNLMSAELERYKDLYAREAVERVEQTTPIVAPKGSVLVLKLQDNQHPYLQSELAEMTNQMKLKLGVDVILIQGWDVVGFWEKGKHK
jgi:DNA polymerase III alpha subunit (gram-positive type)